MTSLCGTVKSSVVARDRFDTDPDPNFHSDAGSGSGLASKRCRFTYGFYTCRKIGSKKLILFSAVPAFSILINGNGVMILSFFDNILKFSGKKVEKITVLGIDTDPIGRIQIWIHNIGK